MRRERGIGAEEIKPDEVMKAAMENDMALIKALEKGDNKTARKLIDKQVDEIGVDQTIVDEAQELTKQQLKDHLNKKKLN